MNYLYLPGVINNFASAPHTPAMDITGDIDLRVFCAADTWKAGSGQVLLSMWAGGTNSAYQLFISNAGVFSLFWEDTVPSTKNANCTQNLTTIFNTGVPIWLRATMKVDNGASGHDITFYSSRDGLTWVQLGAVVTQAGTTAINVCTDVLTIGIQHAATQPFFGKVFYAELRNGINGTIVANPDFRGYVSSGFSDSAGNVWTINASGNPPIPTAQLVRRGGSNYLFLPGLVNNGVTTPDSAQVSVIGDLDVRARILPDYGLANYITNRSIIGQYTGVPATTGWLFERSTVGNLTLYHSDGSTITGTSSSPRYPQLGSPHWVRVTRTTADGSISFYYSASDTNDSTQAVWTSLGSVSSTTGALADSNIAMRIGGFGSSGSDPFPGNIYKVEVRKGVNGTLVASPDFTTQGLASGFSDAQGNVWTINTSGTPAAALVSRTAI